MWTQTSQPTHRSRSISHQLCKLYMLSYCWILKMQSTGQTSRQASQPVQLSALMTASSFGSFLRGPCLAIGRIPTQSKDKTCYNVIIGTNRSPANRVRGVFGHYQHFL